MGSMMQGAWHDDEGVTQAKNVYLKEIHPTCCFPAQRPISVLRVLVEESNGVGAAVTGIGAMASNIANACEFSEFLLIGFQLIDTIPSF